MISLIKTKDKVIQKNLAKELKSKMNIRRSIINIQTSKTLIKNNLSGTLKPNEVQNRLKKMREDLSNKQEEIEKLNKAITEIDAQQAIVNREIKRLSAENSKIKETQSENDNFSSEVDKRKKTQNKKIEIIRSTSHLKKSISTI